jgi:flavin reductase (DIM6/NTAB) family NADH-FMN oxidoreductase RutF
MEGLISMVKEQLVVDPATTPAPLIYKLLIGSIVPRPIAFVSTVSPDGAHNLAPFSFFNAVCAEPPVITFANGYRVPSKDTLANVRATGEFVVNIVTEEIAEAMNLCAGDYPAEASEFEISGLTPVASDLVKAPRVRESPINMECRVLQILDLSTKPHGGSLVIGEVVRFHVDRALTNNFRIDADVLRAIGRMGGSEYTRTRERFAMVRPEV